MINIIPKPQETNFLEGGCKIDEKPTICRLDFEKFKAVWEGLNCPFEVTQEGQGKVTFLKNEQMGNEEYKIRISEVKIQITYSCDQSVFRAVSTLSQILAQRKNGMVPCLELHDFPDIPTRGLMLFVSDNQLPKMEVLYQLVDMMAPLKYNMLQLYFDTFVFEYDSFRRHLEGKAYMTAKEIKDLDAYCSKHFIELSANQNALGHMAAWVTRDEFRHLAIQSDDGTPFGTINPLLEETFEFATQIFDDLLPYFSSPLVHIGMDEPYGLGAGSTREYCETFGADTLFVDYLTKISDYVKEKHKKRSMFWGDFAAKYPKCINSIPKDIIYVDWGYEPGHKFDRNSQACKDAELDFYVAPGTSTWNTFAGRTDIMIQNIQFSAESGRTFGAKGFLLTDWGSAGYCHAPILRWMSYIFGAAFSWNSGYSESFSESENERDCFYRNEIIHGVLAYFDDVVLKSSGERSCADVIFRMGNYWHLEQPDCAATWNGTTLAKNFFHRARKGFAPTEKLSEQSLLKIKEYMDALRDELDECRIGHKDGKMMMEEIKYACESASSAAAIMAISGAKAENRSIGLDTPDIGEMIKQHSIRWNARYRKEGEEVWVNLLKVWEGDLK